MNRLITWIAVAFLLLSGLLVGTTAQAKDITWGRTATSAPQLRDITWGKAQAHRKAWGTDVTHSRSDSGYAAPIRVRCNTGTVLTLYTGQTSHSGPTGCSLSGVDAIYAGADQAVRCFNQLPPYNTPYFIGGWRSVGSAQSLDCFMQRPL